MGVVRGVGVAEREDGVGFREELFGELVVAAEEGTEALRDTEV